MRPQSGPTLIKPYTNMNPFKALAYWYDKKMALKAIKKAMKHLENDNFFTCFLLASENFDAHNEYWWSLYDGAFCVSVGGKLQSLGYPFADAYETRKMMLSLLYVLVESGEFREITGFKGYYMNPNY